MAAGPDRAGLDRRAQRRRRWTTTSWNCCWPSCPARVGYDVVQVQDEADVEAPAFTGDPCRDGRGARDVRLTLRDVILVRADAGVRSATGAAASTSARLDHRSRRAPFAYVRGYAWADVEIGRHPAPLRHHPPGVGGADVALAQAAELLAGPAAGDRRPWCSPATATPTGGDDVAPDPRTRCGIRG